jgi:hypothetical protein
MLVLVAGSCSRPAHVAPPLREWASSSRTRRTTLNFPHATRTLGYAMALVYGIINDGVKGTMSYVSLGGWLEVVAICKAKGTYGGAQAAGLTTVTVLVHVVKLDVFRTDRRASEDDGLLVQKLGVEGGQGEPRGRPARQRGQAGAAPGQRRGQ